MGDMTADTYEIVPLSAADADRLRTAGRKAYVADDKPEFPCRRYPSEAEVGEEMILVSHDPFTPTRPTGRLRGRSTETR